MKIMLRIVLIPLAIAAGLLECLTGCSAVKEQASATEKDLIDCTKAEAAEAIATYAPTLEAMLVDGASSAGKLDWERVKSATRSYATDAARCVIASTISRLMNPPAAAPGAPQSSPLALDQIEVAKGWEDMRASQLGGARFKLPGGGAL